MENLKIDWYILKHEGEVTDFDDKITELRKKHSSIYVVSLSKKSYSLKRFFQYVKLFRSVKKTNNAYYLEMFGMPFFVPIARVMLGEKKSIMAIHNAHVPKGGSKYRIAKIYRDITVRMYSKFQTFSKSQREYLKNMQPKAKVQFIPFALKDYGESKLVLPEKDYPIFMNFGNIRPYKCIDVLIEAAQEAYEETKKSFKVIIAGQCDDWEKFDSLIRYPELFDLRIERVENDDIPDLFAEADFFVAPYQDIAQSGSSIVAINYGLPIIASKLEAFEEYIIDGKNGFLIAPADKQDLKKVLIYVLNNYEKVYPQLKHNVEIIKQKVWKACWKLLSLCRHCRRDRVSQSVRRKR